MARRATRVRRLSADEKESCPQLRIVTNTPVARQAAGQLKNWMHDLLKLCRTKSMQRRASWGLQPSGQSEELAALIRCD